MLWNVFKDNSPLQLITDQRVTNLNQVLNYFKAGKQELQQTFHRRTDVSEHFITWQTMFDLEVICRTDLKWIAAKQSKTDKLLKYHILAPLGITMQKSHTIPWQLLHIL